MGYWFNNEQTLGIEVGAMVVEGQAAHFAAAATNGAILARPFLDVTTATQQAVLVSFPGVSSGSVNMRASSANFYEGHVDLTEKALDEGGFRLYSLLGYRYFRYDENIGMRQVLNPSDPKFVPGTMVISNDNFNTHNEFNGLDMGFRGEFIWDRLSVDVLARMALGHIERSVNINGNQVILVPGASPVVRTRGILALDSNSGLTGTGDWKVLPEGGVNLNWQVRPNVNLRFGYSVLLLTGVARAADKIDTTINQDFFDRNSTLGQIRPANNNDRTSVWIQSLNFGVVWTY
jgi:hypothetical protein